MAPATCTSHSAARPELEHLAHDGGTVDGRLGVRHGHDRRVAAEGGGPAAGLDRLGLLPARLAQVGVQVDEAGRHDAAAGVEHARVRRVEVGPTAAMRPPSTTTSARRARRVDDVAALMTIDRPRSIAGQPIVGSEPRRVRPRPSVDRGRVPTPSSRNRTAMRTATPLRTWSVIDRRGQVGHLGGDLDAPVHRARVHHQGVGRRAGRPGRR